MEDRVLGATMNSDYFQKNSEYDLCCAGLLFPESFLSVISLNNLQ